MARRIFTHQPIAMARIPLRPAAEDGDSAGLLREGVFLASRSVERAADSPPMAGASRIAATMRAYDIRSRTRTTPHGVFSGVAPAPFTADTPALHLGDRHRAITSPSPGWLAGVADLLLDEAGVLPRLTLTTNNLTLRRGGRWEAEHPAPGGTAQLGSVRATEVSVWLLDTCRGGADAAEVLAALAGCHSAVSEAAIGGAVRQMIRSGLILTDLLPTDLRDDPLGHLLGMLPSSARLRAVLGRLRELLVHADEHSPGTEVRLQLLRAARQAADDVLAMERPLTVDTLADATLTLPHALGEKAAQAADVLWQVGQLASPATRYHPKFLAAYGHHRMVPLLEAVDPVSGIGPPEESDAIGAEGDIESRRAARLARLLAEATIHGTREVIVDEELVQQLAHENPALPPRTAEIHVRFFRYATGELGLVVCPDSGSQDAGSAPGRWARWLPQLAPNEPRPGDEGEPLIAEIVCRPRTARTAGLAVETGFAPYRIPLGVPARDGDLTPDDLLITTTGQHLMLWSARHDRQVIPVLYSRLAPDLLPPAARTLHLIGHAGTRPWHTWSWGPAGHAPYTPRVRYKNILLAPARWALPEELTDSAADRRAWDQALAAWCTDALPAPPDVVVVVEVDRQLPLDLRQDEDRELLRRCVHRGARAVTEVLGGPGADDTVLTGPGGAGHLLELVVPLTRRQAPAPPRRDPRSAPRAHGSGRYLPGSSRLSAALAVPVRLQNAVLQQLVAALGDTAEAIDHWFWLRYETPALGPHLRIRFHGRPDDVTAHIQPRLAAFAARLEDQQLSSGLHFEPYIRETERYGGQGAISAAEQVFATDSALALLGLTHAHGDDRLLIAAVSTADIAYALTDTDRIGDALRVGNLAAEDRRRRDAMRLRLRATADPAVLIPPQLDAARSQRQDALTAYRRTLTGKETPALYASDLVHMHANRLLGPDPAAERIARSLALDLLHRARDRQH